MKIRNYTSNLVPAICLIAAFLVSINLTAQHNFEYYNNGTIVHINADCAVTVKGDVHNVGANSNNTGTANFTNNGFLEVQGHMYTNSQLQQRGTGITRMHNRLVNTNENQFIQVDYGVRGGQSTIGFNDGSFYDLELANSQGVVWLNGSGDVDVRNSVDFKPSSRTVDGQFYPAGTDNRIITDDPNALPGNGSGYSATFGMFNTATGLANFRNNTITQGGNVSTTDNRYVQGRLRRAVNSGDFGFPVGLEPNASATAARGVQYSAINLASNNYDVVEVYFEQGSDNTVPGAVEECGIELDCFSGTSHGEWVYEDLNGSGNGTYEMTIYPQNYTLACDDGTEDYVITKDNAISGTANDCGTSPVGLMRSGFDGFSEFAFATGMVAMDPCSADASAMGEGPAGPSMTQICLGEDITLTDSGTGGDTYAWAEPTTGYSASTQVATVTGGDLPTAVGMYTYTVTVTNASGCSETSEVTIEIVDCAIPCNIALSTTPVYNNPGCDGDADGSVVYTFTGTQGPFTYTIDGGAAIAATSPLTISSLEDGTYTVVITDSNPDQTCEITDMFTLTNSMTPLECAPPCDLAITATSPTDATCDGEADGSVEIIFTGNEGPFTYTLDGGAATAATSPLTITGLEDGMYTVVIDDSNLNACEQTTMFTIANSMTPAECAGPELCCNGIDDDFDGEIDEEDVVDCPDKDGDGIADDCDLDDDNDGILDLDECNLCESIVENASAEMPDISFNELRPEGTVPGWETTASDNLIELWDNGAFGYTSQEGNQMFELNGTEASTLFQTLCVPEGATFTWSIWHRGRDGVDVANVKIGADIATASVVAVMSDGTTWRNYTGSYTVPIGQANTVVAFQAVSGSTGDASIGNFIDNLEFTLTALPSCPDFDNDGIVNSCDLDSDDDGCPDALEGGGSITFAQIMNDTITGGVDADGVPLLSMGGQSVGAAQDSLSSLSCQEICCNGIDDNGDGIIDGPLTICPDNDGDTIPDECDLDDDNDGIPDAVECNPQQVMLAGTASQSSNHTSGFFLPENAYDGDGNNFSHTNELSSAEHEWWQLDLGSSQDIDLVNIANRPNCCPERLDNVYVMLSDTPLSSANTSNLSMGLSAANAFTQLGVAGANNYVEFPDNATGRYLQVQKAGGSQNTTTIVSLGEVMIVECVDTDMDMIPDVFDTDSDNDGCPDMIEAGYDLSLIAGYTTGDTVIDYTTNAVGSNGLFDGLETAADNGTLNYAVQSNYIIDGDCVEICCNGIDDNGDGDIDGPITVCPDNDLDGVPDECDLDDDNDGILDADECGLPLAPATPIVADGVADSQFPIGQWEILVFGGHQGVAGSTQEDPVLQDGTPGSPLLHAEGYSSYGETLLSFSDPQILEVEDPTDSWINEGVSMVDNPVNGGYMPTGVNTSSVWSYVIRRKLIFDQLIVVGEPGNRFDDHGELFVNGVREGVIIGFEPSLPANAVIMYQASAGDEIEIRLSNAGGLGGFTIATEVEEESCDTDGDMIPDYLDLDSDGDGCPDANEAGLPMGVTIQADSTVAGPYGANGYADVLESPAESGMSIYSIASTGGTDNFQNDMAFDACGGIEVTKALTDVTTTGASQLGYAIATYEFEIFAESMLSNIELNDDFATNFGSAFQSVVGGPTISTPSNNATNDPTPNAGFTGSGANTNLLSPGGSLDAGDSITVQVMVEVDLDLLSNPTENSATANGTTSLGSVKSDVSDDVSDINNDGDSDNDPMGGSADPTLFIAVPSIHLAKALNSQVDNMDGTNTVTYRHVLKNTGNTVLENIQLTDDIETTYCGGISSITSTSIVASDAMTDPMLNAAYNGGDGTADINLFDGASGVLNPEQEITVEIVAVVTNADIMAACPVPYLNQSEVTGTPTDGAGTTLVDPTTGMDFADVTDLSDSGATPDSNNPGAPGDTGGSDDPTPVYLPADIGIVKSITSIVPAASGIQGNYDATIKYTVRNTGANGVEDINLIDDLSTQWGGAFVGVTTLPVVTDPADNIGTGNEPTANMNYDGDTDTNLLSGDGRLGTGSGGKYIEVVVVVEVDASEAPSTGLENQAAVNGTDEGPTGGAVADISDDNTSSPDADDAFGANDNAVGDSGNGGTNDPTPLFLPEVATTKALVSTIPAASGTSGHFDATFAIKVQNTGTTPLENIQVVDDLSVYIGSAYVQTIQTAMITASTADTDPTPNANFGTGSDYDLFDGTDGLLQPGQIITLEIVIELDAAQLNDTNDENQVVASALPTDGAGTALLAPGGIVAFMPVTDMSDDGSSSPNNGDPTDPNNTATGGTAGDFGNPTPIMINPGITVTKALTGLPTPTATVGNYDATYSFVVCNTGGEALIDISLEDDFAVQFGTDAIVGITAAPSDGAQMGNVGIAYPAVNPSFTGMGTGAQLFISSATAGLSAGACTEVLVTIEVDVDELPETAENLASVSAETGDGTTVSDDSDDTTDIDGVAGADNPGLTNDDPTPFPPLAQIAVAKSVASTAVQSDGDVKVVFNINVENIGNTNLTMLQVTEELAGILPAADPVSQDLVVSVVNITASTAPTANTGFDGTGDTDLLIGTDGVLEPNQQYQIVVEMDVDPATFGAIMPQPVTNQVDAEGTPAFANGAAIPDPVSPGSTLGSVMDTSDSGTDPESNNMNADVPDGDDATDLDNPTPVVMPGILELTKASSAPTPAASGIPGNSEITYIFVVKNTGGVLIDEVSLSDNFFGQFGSGFVDVITDPAVSAMVTDGMSIDPSLVATFNGTTPNDILVNQGTLAPNDSFEVTVTLELNMDMLPSDASNSAEVEGTDPDDAIVTDISDDVTDLDGDMNPDNPGMTNDDPTPVPAAPSIGVAKSVGVATQSATDPDIYTVTYRHIVQNTGNTQLRNLSLIDDMVTALQGGYVGVTNIEVMNINATTPPTAAAPTTDMDGVNDALDKTTGVLDPSQQYMVDITVEIDQTAITGVQPLLNQSTAEAQPTDDTGANLVDPSTGTDFPVVSDDSDSGMDPDGDNEGAPNDPVGGQTYDDPTPLSIPGIIGVVKTITDVTEMPVNSGMYEVTAEFLVKNTGSNNLAGIGLEDNVDSQWDDAFVSNTAPTILSQQSSTAVTANAGYNGDAMSNILSDDGELAPGDSVVVEVVYTIDATMASATGLTNSATASGTDPLGNDIMDMSDDNTSSNDDADPAGTNPNGAGDMMNGQNDPSPISIPSIGAAKTVTSVTPATTPGNFEVTYEITVENNGTTPLENISLMDDAAMMLTPAYIGVVTAPAIDMSSASTDPTIGGLPAIFAGTDGLLLPGEQIKVSYTVELDASEVPTAGLTNQATTEGLPTDGMGGALLDPNNPGVEFAPVSDLSDSGTDPNGENATAPGNGDGPNTYDDPTPVPPMADIRVAKRVDNYMDAASGIVGNVDVAYIIEVENTGNTILESISLEDDLRLQFGTAFIQILPGGVTNGAFDAGFVGSIPGIEVLDGATDLAPGETIEVMMNIELDPDAAGAIYNTRGELENQATATGTPVDDMGNSIPDPNDPTQDLADVSDLSDSGDDPTTDNTADPNNGNGPNENDDPTVLSVTSIVVAKEIADVTPSATQGNFDVTIRYHVSNDGNEDLSELSLMDDIVGQYGAAYIDVITQPTFVANTTNSGPTLATTYAGTGDLLVPSIPDVLQPNQGFTIDVVVEVDADGVTGILYNQAEVSGQPVDETFTPYGNPVTDLSDSGSDPETDNPLEFDDNGTAQDSTSLELPNISLVKRQVGYVETVDGAYGNVDLTFEYTLQNTGNVSIFNLQLSDNLVGQLGNGFVEVISSQITASDATANPIPSLTFNGATPGNIFVGGDGELEPGQSITVEVVIEFNPIADGLLAPLTNTATASGTSPNGTEASDSSDDGDDPLTNNDMAPGQGTGANDFDDPTPVEVPRVYVTKELQGFERAASNEVGNYDLTFSIKMQNTGNVDLQLLQIEDDMVAQFGSSFVEVLSTSFGPATDITGPAIPTLNAAYLGTASDGNIFDGVTGIATTLQTVEVIVVLEVDPDAASPSELITNQAEGFGTDMRGTTVDDLSDDGTDLLSDNGEGTVDDPTPIALPSINASKQILSFEEAKSDVEGNVDVILEFTVENTGNMPLEDISLVDELEAQLGGAFVSVIDVPSITASTAMTDPVVNVDYNGSDETDMFDGESGELLTDQQLTVQVEVELNPNGTDAIVPLENFATATGIDSLDTEATDVSDSGPLSEDNNVGEPGDTGGQDDPTLLELPSISVAKSVQDFTRLASSGIVGNFDVTYRFEVKNTGNVTLENINLLDDINAQLGAGFVRKVPDLELGDDNPKVINGDATIAPTGNNGFDGGIVDDNMLSNDGQLEQDQTFVIELVVEVNPNNFAAPDTLFNEATADGTYNSIADGPLVVVDDSDDGLVAESNNLKGALCPESDNPTPLILSDINISKEVVDVMDAASDQEGNLDVLFEMQIKNKGNDTLTQINVVDDIETQFGAAFVQTIGEPVITSSDATADPTVNTDYAGGSEGLFDGTDGTLAPNEIITVQIMAEIDPDMVADTITNQATASSVNPAGETVTDDSDHGDDPESNNPGFEGDTGGMDDATPIAVPVISVTKELVTFEGSDIEGITNVTYSLVVQNTGNVPLENISLIDAMDAPELLGAAHVGIDMTNPPMITSSMADMDPAINGGFDGTAANANIFDGMSGLMQPGQRLVVTFVGQLDVSLAADPTQLFNQATATGDNDGETVTDVSDSGTDPTTNNLDADTNDGNGPAGPDDPTPVFPCFSNGEVACKGNVNLSLDPVTCMTEVTPNMVGVGISEFCAFYYSLELRDENGDIIPDNILDGSYIGQMIEYSITEPEDGNSCWGVLTLEFKFKPIIECSAADTLSCTQAFDESVVRPDVSMSCADVELLLVNEEFTTLNCDSLFSSMMVREYVAVDQYGNTSDTCEQVVLLERTNLDSISPVQPFAVYNDKALSCSDGFETTSAGYPFPSVSVTGAPRLRVSDEGFVDLFPFDADVICNGFAEFEDEILPGSTDCVTKILRTFTIGEWWCGGTNERDFVQLIEVVDFDGPEMVCPSDITVSTASFTCESEVSVSLPTASELCNGNNVTIDLGTPAGFFEDYNGAEIMMPVGVHTLTYTAYDDCGNDSQCTFTVTVQDDADPIAICDQFTEVSLSLNTNTYITAEAIDDGSFDECGDVTIGIARMTDPGFDDLTGFGPQVDITCDDAGSSFMVGLLVTDSGGNTNMCMASVSVKDKVDARMIVPGPVTVDCGFAYDPANPAAFFGDIEVLDNCPASNTIQDEIVGELTTCGTGVLTREIRLFNPQGVLLEFKTQAITFAPGDPLTYSDITPPTAELDFDGCGIDAINALAVDIPIIPQGICQQTSIAVESDTFPFTQSDGACLKILRTFSVIDWCISDGPGSIFDPWQFTQIIKVNNTDAPEFTDVFAARVDTSYATDCGGLFVAGLTATSDDLCTPSDEVNRSFEVLDASGTVIRTGAGHDASNDFDLGEYTIRFIAEDGCGNQAVRESTVTVISGKRPTPYCFDGLSTSLTLMDPDNDGDFEAMVMLGTDFFDAGSYHPCGLDVQVSFSEDLTDQVKVFDCSQLGPQTVELWVTDSNGNQDFCTSTVDIQDNDNLCNQMNRASVQGRIYTESDAQLTDVMVALESIETISDMTDDAGQYDFMDMPQGGSYVIAPEKDDDVLNGVSTLDLVMIQRHLLGIQEFDNVFQYIAADINNDEKLRSSDLLALRKVILGINDKFDNNTSWRFIDEGHTFDDQTDPWTSELPETYQINQLDQDMWVDFIAVKTGDINGNVVTDLQATSETRNGQTFSIELPNVSVESGQVYEVKVLATEAQNIRGMQHAMNIEGVEVLEVQAGKMNISTNDYTIDRDQFKTSYANAVGDYVQQGAVLYTLVIRAQASGQLADMITLDSKKIAPEAYLGQDLDVADLEIEWREGADVQAVEFIVVGSASPNPWRHQTDIDFEIPRAGAVTLTVRDAAGRLILTDESQFDAGTGTFTVTDDQVTMTGILLYELRFEDQVINKKMIKIQ